MQLSLKHGVEAKSYDELAKAEKLKPLEVELRRLEDLSKSIVDDFAYMRAREEEMRDTNGKLTIFPPLSRWYVLSIYPAFFLHVSLFILMKLGKLDTCVSTILCYSLLCPQQFFCLLLDPISYIEYQF